jgi:hypothetical protein
VQVEELAPGLWRWTARGSEGEHESSCYYVESAEATLLVDPLVPGDDAERFWRALDRDVERRRSPVIVLLTGAPHARSAATVVERYGGDVVGPDLGAAAGDLVTGDVRMLTGGAFHLPSHRAIAAGHLLAVEGGALSLPESPGAVADLESWVDLPFAWLLLASGPVEDGRAALRAALAAQDATRRETARSQSSRTSLENGPTASQ